MILGDGLSAPSRVYFLAARSVSVCRGTGLPMIRCVPWYARRSPGYCERKGNAGGLSSSIMLAGIAGPAAAKGMVDGMKVVLSDVDNGGSSSPCMTVNFDGLKVCIAGRPTLCQIVNRGVRVGRELVLPSAGAGFLRALVLPAYPVLRQQLDRRRVLDLVLGPPLL